MAANETIVYSIDYPSPIPDGLFRSLLERLPGTMAKKIGQYRRWEDAHGSLLGKVLLTMALREAGSAATLDDLRYNEYQRPYLETGPDFNISHSGNRVACILGTQGRVGIDLEAIRPMDIEDFRGQFTVKEWKTIMGAAERMDIFYHYWTAKESIIKADGRGLNVPLARLVIDEGTDIVLGEDRWQLRRIDAFAGYACHMAADEVSEPRIKVVGLEEILSFIYTN